MAHRTLLDLFNQARTYLDTDELNFPDDLCNILFQRIWFQAVALEREWRFLQQYGTIDVLAGTALVPASFTITDDAAGTTATVGAVRLYTVAWNDGLLWQREYVAGEAESADAVGTPTAYSELNTGPQRSIRLFPIPGSDGTIRADFYADLVYPAPPGGGGPYDVTLDPLPDEFDSCLLEGLLAEMYMREEDTDLYQQHRQMFLEQTGSIRSNWRYSQQRPVVMAGRARRPGTSQGGFDDMGRFTRPVAG